MKMPICISPRPFTNYQMQNIEYYPICTIAKNVPCKNRSCIEELDGFHLKIIYTLEAFENILETNKQYIVNSYADKTKTNKLAS
jgi:hypothetical protein